MEPHQILLGILLLALFLRLCAGALDLGRIDDYAQDRDWTVHRKSWAPFGPGWFGTQYARIYRVEFTDADGSRHEAYVKTSMMSGVYLTEDRVVQRSSRLDELEAENTELKRRLAELEARDPSEV